jgi:alkanesulfonate monooxygenase SsuD/methylene tetrahydromethanopterin reductase-like flavin-dependent oxidoreductase (luciferase family)
MTTTRGFGLAGESPTGTIYSAARAAEAAGYDSFWLSQPREGSTLATLQRVAGETRRIRVGVGAIPLTSLTPEEIVGHISELSLPRDRLRLGIGSGTGAGSLDRLRWGVEQLRSLLDVEIVVAPLGPKMCALAGELADTVLLNWLTPAYAETSMKWVRDGASSVGRAVPTVASYVRCAIGADSRSRLEAECDRYGSFPHYAAHFARQGVRPIETAIHARDPDELREVLRGYELVLNHVVVRAITSHDAPSEVLALIEATKPAD